MKLYGQLGYGGWMTLSPPHPLKLGHLYASHILCWNLFSWDNLGIKDISSPLASALSTALCGVGLFVRQSSQAECHAGEEAVFAWALC